MWNSLSNINFYENLLERRSKEKQRLTENDVNLLKLCRTCLREAPDTDNLLKDFEIGAMNINLDGKLLKMIDMLRESSGLEVEESDLLPHQICNNCIQNVSGAYFFRMQSHKAEKTLQKLIAALSEDETEENYENIQHLEETIKDAKEETLEDESDEDHRDENQPDAVQPDEDEPDKEGNCELMEIELNSIQYKIETDGDSTEIISDSVITNEDIIEEQECSDNGEEFHVEYIENDKTDDEEVKSLVNFVVELDKEMQEKPHKSLSKCSACGETFEFKKDLHEHIKVAHPTIKAFECDTCHSRFTKIQTLKRHLKIHQADQKNKLCTFCGKRFTRADDLKRHVRTHTNERPYVCNLCPKRYKQTSELKEHVITHSREKVYNCDVCGKCLLTRNGYYVHMKVHAGVKNHKCNVCEKQFVTSGELNSHVRHIHDKDRPFACTFKNCERRFVTKLSLEIHQRAHTGERPFPCSICGKKLATASSLSDHVKMHTGEKRFFCKVCKKSFSNSSSLKKHVLRHSSSECEVNLISLDELSQHVQSDEMENDRFEDEEMNSDILVDPPDEEQSPSDIKEQSTEHCRYLIEYDDTEVVQETLAEENAVDDYLQS